MEPGLIWDSDVTNHWAVARTIIMQEGKAQAALSDAGFTSYVPKYLWLSRFHGKTISRPRVLFPGYILFQLIQDQWKRIFQLDHIVGLLMSGEHPAPVLPTVVQELRSREGPDGLIRLPDKSARIRFQNGQCVRVKRGALMGLEGIFQSGYGGERVKVQFNLLGKGRDIIMRFDELEAAEGKFHVKHKSRYGRRKRYYSRPSYPLQLGA